MNNLNNLYRQVIMDHYKRPRNKGLTEDPTYKEVHLKNPSCGDDITIQSKIENGVIEDMKHDGVGCSICCSSASVMTETLIGRTEQEANVIIENYYQMIKGNEFDIDMDMGEAVVYEGVNQFPARVKCATIAWQAAKKSIDKE